MISRCAIVCVAFLYILRVVAVPTSLPLDANPLPHEKRVGPGQYKNAKCSDQYIGDPTASPFLRWQAADCDYAWIDAGINFRQNYTESVQHFFNAPEGFHCWDIGQRSECIITGGFSCDESKYPAGWLLLQSFVNLHNASPTDGVEDG